MRILIAIASCNRDIHNGLNDAVRSTWLQGYSGDHVFAAGRGSEPLHPDELVLDCKDDYFSLPEKTHALMTWALTQGYDYIFKCDTDSYVMLDRLLESNFFFYDYVGTFNGTPGERNTVYGQCYPWASGGSGYWLSKRAATHLVSFPPTHKSRCPVLSYNCEDLGVGQVLGPEIAAKRLTAHHDSRYGRSFNEDFSCEYTAHFCSHGEKRKFNPKWLFDHHAANKVAK